MKRSFAQQGTQFDLGLSNRWHTTSIFVSVLQSLLRHLNHMVRHLLRMNRTKVSANEVGEGWEFVGLYERRPCCGSVRRIILLLLPKLKEFFRSLEGRKQQDIIIIVVVTIINVTTAARIGSHAGDRSETFIKGMVMLLFDDHIAGMNQFVEVMMMMSQHCLQHESSWKSRTIALEGIFSTEISL